MRPLNHLPGSVLLAVSLLVALAGPADASGDSWYRVRLSPGAARGADAASAALEIERMRALADRLGVAVEPTLGVADAGAIRSRIQAERQPARSPVGATEASLLELLRWGRVRVPDTGATELLGRLESDPEVDLIEPVALAELSAFVPDEEYLLNQQLWLDMVALPEAWASSDPPGGLERARVAIIDGGTDWMHPDLQENVSINSVEIPGDGVDQDANGFVDDVHGWAFATGSGDPSPLPGLAFSGRHGTHVAGLVGAVLGNGLGVAGAGGNPELILVNAAHPTIDGAIAWGYEGILYALTRDADIINCSWRTARFLTAWASDAPWSAFEALVLRVAREAGALVIAATGNDGNPDLWSTPAAYEDCMAVGATSNTEVVPWVLTNGGDWVDVMAPGQFMISTVPRGSTGHLGPYDLLSGTSMAAALTSGVAALVKGQHPEWTAEQLRSRLRWTGVSYDSLGDVPLLNAYRALTVPDRPDVVLAVDGLADADGDGLAEGGEVVDLRFSARALFARQVGVQVELESDDPWLTPLIDRLTISSLGTEAELEFARGLKFWVHPSTPPGHIASVRLRPVVGGVPGPVTNGFVQLRPLTARVAGGAITVQASVNGVLGAATQVVSRVVHTPALGRNGEPFGYLQKAALILADGQARVSDALLPRAPVSPFKDFTALQDGLVRSALPDGTTELSLRYGDRGAANGLGVNVRQVVRVPGATAGSFVIVEYAITAVETALPDLRWALALDWSAPAAPGGNGYLPEQLEVMGPGMLVRAAEAGEGTGVAGARLLGDISGIGIRSLREWADDTAPGWNIPGAFSSTVKDSVLWELVQPGEGDDLAATGARVGVLSAGLGAFERGETKSVAVAFAIGEDDADLESRLEQARVDWEARRDGLDPSSLRDSVLRFSRNPFRSETELSYSLGAAGPVRVTIYDLRGRRVRELLDAQRPPGVHRVLWDGTDASGAAVASGVYLLQLQTPATTETVRVTRVR